jgi:hypothetical protein
LGYILPVDSDASSKAIFFLFIWDLEQSKPQEEAFALSEASGCFDQGRDRGIPQRNLARSVDPDYGN